MNEHEQLAEFHTALGEILMPAFRKATKALAGLKKSSERAHALGVLFLPAIEDALDVIAELDEDEEGEEGEEEDDEETFDPDLDDEDDEEEEGEAKARKRYQS